MVYNRVSWLHALSKLMKCVAGARGRAGAPVKFSVGEFRRILEPFAEDADHPGAVPGSRPDSTAGSKAVRSTTGVFVRRRSTCCPAHWSVRYGWHLMALLPPKLTAPNRVAVASWAP